MARLRSPPDCASRAEAPHQPDADRRAHFMATSWMRSRQSELRRRAVGGAPSALSNTGRVAAGHLHVATGHGDVCPLTFGSAAITASLPAELAELCDQLADEARDAQTLTGVGTDLGEGSDTGQPSHSSGSALKDGPQAPTPPDAGRVWATLLAASALRAQPFCMLASKNEGCVEHDRTIVDAALEWIEAAAAAAPKLGLLMPMLRRRAEAYVEAWDTEQTGCIAATKVSNARYNKLRSLEDVRRIAAFTIIKFWRTQELAGVLVSQPSDPLRRHERCVLLCTTLLVALTVDIWLHWSRGATCCGEARSRLGCHADPATPCLGFSGDCSALWEQFSSVPTLAAALGPEDNCFAFPDEEQTWDRILAGLIMAACTLPVRWVFTRCLELANEAAGMPDIWLTWVGLPRVLLGRIDWAYAARATSPLKRLAAKWARDPEVFAFMWLKHALGLDRRQQAGHGHAAGGHDVGRPLQEVRGHSELHAQRESAAAEAGWAAPAQAASARGRKFRGKAKNVVGQVRPVKPHGRHADGPVSPRHAGRSPRHSTQAAALPQQMGAEAEHSAGHRAHAADGVELSAADKRRMEAAEEAHDETVADARFKAAARVGVYGVIYCTWALLSWFVFTYGSLMYSQLGQSVEAAFLRAWGVGFGLDNLAQLRSTAQAAVWDGLLIVALDRAGLLGTQRWFEDFVDHCSIQAAVCHRVGEGQWKQLTGYIQFMRRVETE